MTMTGFGAREVLSDPQSFALPLDFDDPNETFQIEIYDEPEAEAYRIANEKQGAFGSARLPTHYGHFTTRQNVQFNWIPLARSADVMDLLASVHLHA